MTKEKKILINQVWIEYHGIQGIIPSVLITWVVRNQDVIQDQLAHMPIFLQILEASWAGIFNYRWFHSYQRLYSYVMLHEIQVIFF